MLVYPEHAIQDKHYIGAYFRHKKKLWLEDTKTPKSKVENHCVKKTSHRIF